MLAHPARTLMREQHLAKFRRCLDFAAVRLAPAAPGHVVKAIDRLEVVENVCILGALARGDLPKGELNGI